MGWCQFGRRMNADPHSKRIPPCPNRVNPEQTYCPEHRLQALQRLPDRSIGDKRGLYWSLTSAKVRRPT